jgi:NAD(P)-dependent dehydrogenase (short-subunit alcohol dehydrogenase family)
VSEIGRFDQRLEDGPQDKPTKPNLKTLDIDLIGVLYTARIAMWYFVNDERENPGPRTICFTASMSSFYGANFGVMYGASKALVQRECKAARLYKC